MVISAENAILYSNKTPPPIQNPFRLKLPPSCGMTLAAQCRLPGCRESHIGCLLTPAYRVELTARIAAASPMFRLPSSPRSPEPSDTLMPMGPNDKPLVSEPPETAHTRLRAPSSAPHRQWRHVVQNISLINTNRDNIF